MKLHKQEHAGFRQETRSNDGAILASFRRVIELAEEALERRASAESDRAVGVEQERDVAPPGSEAWLADVSARAAFGDVDQALDLLRAFTDAHASPQALTLLAQVQRREGRLDDARRASERAERCARRALACARCEQARIEVESGQTAQARDTFEDARSIDPALADAHVGLGSLALHRGDPDVAERCFRDALQSEKSSRALAGLGLARLACGEPRLALPTLEEALDLEPDNASAIHGLVEAAFATGELRAAERRVSAFVELHTGNLDMTFTLAGLRQQLGDDVGARDALQRIEVFDASYPGLAELRAKLG